MRSACCRTWDHLVLPVRTTRAMRRSCRFCWYRMRRSVVSSSSKHASSGTSNNAPLLSVSQPLDCAVWIVCVESARASPFGVPWSKRTTTGRNRFGAQAVGYEVEHGCDLLAGHVELLHDLLDTEVLEVLDHGGHGQAGPLEHTGAAHLAWDALAGRTLGPVP